MRACVDSDGEREVTGHNGTFVLLCRAPSMVLCPHPHELNQNRTKPRAQAPIHQRHLRLHA
jgi:hypothetical protein